MFVTYEELSLLEKLKTPKLNAKKKFVCPQDIRFYLGVYLFHGLIKA